MTTEAFKTAMVHGQTYICTRTRITALTPVRYDCHGRTPDVKLTNPIVYKGKQSGENCNTNICTVYIQYKSCNTYNPYGLCILRPLGKGQYTGGGFTSLTVTAL